MSAPLADKLAFTYDSAAEVCDVSRDVIKRAVAAGDLIPIYLTSRPTIPRDQLEQWIANAPTAKP